ncbi:MAG: MFS transporter [Elusimicrobia bacterium]|nr:MFS transporter [Elusimicrobiota bacterium]
MLGLLLSVNLVNYLDRQVLYSLLPQIQEELAINDAQAGRLASAFMLVYMFAAPPIGYWADKHGRRLWITVGVALWSVATVASGLAATYTLLFLARAAVGIGESCYGAISPSFVAEHYPARQRGSVLALFSMAIPVGSALGYIIGGNIGQHWGWRSAFYIVGVPGLLLAFLTARLKEPRTTIESAPHSAFFSYRALFDIPSFTLVTLALAAMTFALGGYAVWMPSFFHRTWGLDLAQAGTIFGGITVVSGIVGSLAGGWLSDWALRFNSRAHFLVSGLGLVAGMPLAMVALLSRNFHVAAGALFLAEFFLFLNMGPLNAVIVAVTDLKSRSMAFAANIFVLHALGDAISPAIIGAASDAWNLRAALFGASFALGLAGLLCFWGMRHYDRDCARVQHA